MNQLPKEIIKLIFEDCDLKTLINLSVLSKKYLKSVQKIIFNEHEVNFNVNIKMYDIKKIMKLRCNKDMKDEDLNNLTHITHLNLNKNNQITYGIKKLTNLTYLNLGDNKCVVNYCICQLNKLTHLNLGSNKYITDEGIKNLHNLKILYLGSNKHITNEGIKNLHNLIDVNLGFNTNITYDDLLYSGYQNFFN